VDTDLERCVAAAIADEVRCPLSQLSPQTDLFQDLGVDGDDAHDLLLRLSQEFEINLENLQFDRHFGPEGTNLFAVLLPSFWRWRRERLPVTIADLVEAARTHNWPIRYREITA
jgi:acyl carrier protein